LHTHVHREFRVRRALLQWRDLLVGQASPTAGHFRNLVYILISLVTLPLSWLILQALRCVPHPSPMSETKVAT
jgi:hypothetical protein